MDWPLMDPDHSSGCQDTWPWRCILSSCIAPWIQPTIQTLSSILPLVTWKAGMKARFFDVTSATPSKAAVHAFSYQSACNHSVSPDPQILDPAGIGLRNRRGWKLLTGCISAGSFAHVSLSLTKTWQRGCEANACHRSCRTRELPALSKAV